ncbi:MCE family protein [Riemerella anatipestifer]|uniref:MlaD family protein n=1 Tax=Riemerella anatipestifer TaxID=34085 RepID=UPI0021D5B4FB|nr:MlaD family protein [Riemerella anatipestifer]MCU7570627.1 MlaD family protein [Riemerella anatipestifer]
MKFSKELKAGLIAILAIVGFVLLYQFMKGRNIFSMDNVYYVKYDNVQGLSASNAVSINGLKVGQVEEIKPVKAANGHIYFVVKITVDNKFGFAKKSTVEIFEPGLMSGKEVKINLIYDGEQAKNGDTLMGALQQSVFNSLSSEVKPVKDQLSHVLTNLDSTLASTNKIMDEQNRREIKQLLQSLNHTVESFRQTSLQTNQMLSNTDPKIQKMLDNANLATVSAKTTLDKYGNVVEKLDINKLNDAVAKLSLTSDKLNTLISGIQNGEGSLGKIAKDEQLYNNLNQTSKNLNGLIEDIKNNPKRYINISVFGK